MSSNVVHLHPDQRDLEAAWDAYDAARRGEDSLYLDRDSTREQRFAASLETVRLHRRFADMFERACSR